MRALSMLSTSSHSVTGKQMRLNRHFSFRIVTYFHFLFVLLHRQELTV